LDEVDETAKFLGSVNTILNDNGTLRGFSTDGAGALQALRENGVDLGGKKVLLLGAGGAAKAAAFSLAREAAELVVLNRTPEKAAGMAEALRQKLGRKVVGGALSPRSVQEHLRDADVLVNATSAGMHPRSEEGLVKPEWLRRGLVVMDMVYNPVETRLAKDARAAGAHVVSGVEMLIYQGAASFEIWTGQKAPVEVMRKAALSSLAAAAGEGS
jgi:shikimate dehydrogenase